MFLYLKRILQMFKNLTNALFFISFFIIVSVIVSSCNSDKKPENVKQSIDNTFKNNLFLEALCKIKNVDTVKYHIYLDTVIVVDTSESVGLFNFIERVNEPCSHADCSEFRLAYFRKTSTGIVCSKYTSLLICLPFCDMPDSKLLKVGDVPLLATWYTDGNQGNFDYYVSVYDLREESIGRLMLDRVVHEMSDSIVFIGNGTENNEINYKYKGELSFDVSNKSSLRLVNSYSIVKQSNIDSIPNNKIEEGKEFWNYSLRDDSLVLTEVNKRKSD